MGRMHNPGKGKSRSALPYNRTAPSWVQKPEEITAKIVSMAKKGLTPSQIGIKLRDELGVPKYRYLSDTTITRVLKPMGLVGQIPESLYHLIKKAVTLRKHLERNKKDKDAKFRLILIESRIHRTARYFKRTGAVAPTFRYESGSAATLVSA